ncbi:L-seryl-tRNA(Sec) selenium transferase [Mariniblastus sp.]|nr:L-seryl-tRNA(Sec) selenium transferase [Mariniblastus sp.]MDB4755780.1 L-seryl-tRNA(Sec) selenium transferase [Mariniblastus sp.]
MENPFRNLPSVNDLLETPALKKIVDKVSHNVVANNVRSFLDDARERLKDKTTDFNIPSPSEMADSIAEWISTEDQPSLQPVINGTGVILHTGLGRAPLADQAIEAISEVSRGYASVEVSLQTGKRSHRVEAVEKLLKELTGAEAAAVVNNNAAATLLTLSAMADGKEVIVSRGELIEIGGSYRLPDVMTASGSRLKEVGTTNKTRISDYEQAIGDETAALMKVHTSNYLVCGFTESTGIQELVALGKKRNLPVIDDVGSGALVDFSKYGLPNEPTVCDSLAAGADVVLFSGDKLIGGPQCGIVVGKLKQIQKITKHPMMRAMRVDKMTLAGLAETLRLYRDLEQAETKIPLLSMLSSSLDNLRNRANRLIPRLEGLSHLDSVKIIEEKSMMGGGTIPTQTVPTICLQIKPNKLSVQQFSDRLRCTKNPVFGRIQNDFFLLDLRTIQPRQDRLLIDSLGLKNSQQE